MVNFAGWDMPLHYGSQVDEHHLVRQTAGMFDVSHMTIVDVHGQRARAFLSLLLANDVGKLRTPGKALYTCLLNEQGGILDDLIVYLLSSDAFRLVLNAATREKDLGWLEQHSVSFGVDIIERTDLSMIAVQGPQARQAVLGVLSPAFAGATAQLSPFRAAWERELFVGRTGYTGEDGYEIIIPHGSVATLVRSLQDHGVRPAGLAARDTLRLEAGLNLYGEDMDESVTPFEAGLGWTVAWPPVSRDFIGRAALERYKREGIKRKQVGLMLEGKGVLRAHQRLWTPGGGEGAVTSGGFSPTLKRGIALARVPSETESQVTVEIRGRRHAARVVTPPFVRHGKPCVNVDD
jgi:aminomethyltransferase